ncbi:MAG: hypothetical protein KJ795_08265 [Gammaproteobacteria bacterium]|nr:hypothetical protein [Gammaproteobacteria bacterium]MBU1777774.1 hypothetical protein [Gammaproteobacteria bacterium]MBU1969984.1 hypothetical protein [Gammaproteobacteria bacterium]
MKKISNLKLARWAGADGVPEGCARFMRDGDDLPESLAGINVLMGDDDEAYAANLLARGAERVLLGELALRDSGAVQRLSEQYGSEHIGVWLAAVKSGNSWAMADEAPNAGFKCMYPSRAVPGWEMLDGAGATTSTDSEWWLQQMFELGATMALVCMDIHDDDLNICAGLNIAHEGKIWFTPLREPDIDLEPWVRWGKVRQLLLPEPNNRDEAEMARIAEAAMVLAEAGDEEAVTATSLEAEPIQA